MSLLSTIAVISLTQGIASADPISQNMACFSPLSNTYATFPIPYTGEASSNSITSGDTTDFSGASVGLNIDGTLVAAGIGAGVVSFVTDAALLGSIDPFGDGDGVNAVTNTTTATIDATNTVEGTGNFTGAVNVTFFVVSDGVTATIYVESSPGSWTGSGTGGLVTTTLLNVSIPLTEASGSPWTVTSNGGGNISFQAAQGPLPASLTGPPSFAERAAAPVVLLNNLGVSANFYCWPGQSNGPIDPITGLPSSSVGFTPQAPSTIEAVTVNIPPTAPTANDDVATVGAGQSVNIDVLGNDTDPNGNLDATTVAIVAPPGGADTAVVEPDGSITYTNVDGVSPVTFTYEVGDTTALTSNVATVTVNVLGDQCTATCSLDQIIVLPVGGADLVLNQAGLGGPQGDFVVGMISAASIAGPDGIPGTADDTPAAAAPIVLNGSPQLAVGQLWQMTVTNSRGTDFGWDLTGQVTNFTDGAVAPSCDADTPASWNNHCIPGDNLGWAPSAAVAHTQVAGDVAAVTPGTSVYPPGFLLEPDPLAPTGLQSTALTLCSADAGTSGGTFTCDAGLAMAVPASAAQGVYTGVLTLTLA